MELGNNQTVDQTDGDRKADHDQDADEPHIHRLHVRIDFTGVIHSLQERCTDTAGKTDLTAG